MLVYCALPRVEKSLVVSLLLADASLVFNLGELGSSFFVHFVLQVTTHCPVSFAYLSKDVSLVCLFGQCKFHCLCLMGLSLSSNLLFILLQFIVLQPCGLFFQFSLLEDVLLTVLVYILHQVDTSLVLTAPLRLFGLPLLDILILD